MDVKLSLSRVSLGGIRILLGGTVFFVGCLGLGLLSIIPSQRFKVTYYYGRSVGPLILKILGIKVQILNPERLAAAPPCIIIPNHQHLIDVFIYGFLLQKNTVLVGKAGLRYIPIFGCVYAWAGHLFIDRSAKEKAVAVMRKAYHHIKAKGLSVLIAPEGTRSRGRGLLPFKRGPFHMALATELPLLPVAISSFHKNLRYGALEAGTVIIAPLELIPTKGLSLLDSKSLATLAFDRMAQAIKAIDQELSPQATTTASVQE